MLAVPCCPSIYVLTILFQSSNSTYPSRIPNVFLHFSITFFPSSKITTKYHQTVTSFIPLKIRRIRFFFIPISSIERWKTSRIRYINSSFRENKDERMIWIIFTESNLNSLTARAAQYAVERYKNEHIHVDVQSSLNYRIVKRINLPS